MKPDCEFVIGGPKTKLVRCCKLLCDDLAIEFRSGEINRPGDGEV